MAATNENEGIVMKSYVMHNGALHNNALQKETLQRELIKSTTAIHTEVLSDGSITYTYKNKDKLWIKDGLWHRVDGPAVIYNNGNEHWYYQGRLHCEIGPAINSVGGYQV